MNFIVYKHVNKKNGKIYFGITKQKANNRWENGKGYLKKDKDGKYNQPVFAKAIMKYGWDGFTHEIILEGISEAEAKYAERYLIAVYKTNVRKWGHSAKGYNETDGGEGTLGRVASKPTRKKMSEKGKERVGDKNGFYGKSHSEEQKEKWKHRFNKAVMCIETGTIYYSIAEASRNTGADCSAIIRVCKGLQKHAGGFSWKYIE